MKKIKVMIAGIGGASLGTEILKSLKLSGDYEIYGCDISSSAYGHYDKAFHNTFKIERENYVQDVIRSCVVSDVKWLIPGGEEPMVLLSEASDRIVNSGIQLVANAQSIVALFSNKEKTFQCLDNYGIKVPRTCVINEINEISFVGVPCIVKPSTDSGGSRNVFFAITADEVMTYAEFIKRNGSIPIAQEYIDDTEGEFTIGVLSLPDKRIVGSIALRRELSSKLSVNYRGRGGVISSGFSQGYIGEFDHLCQQAKRIAKVIGSQGPINIQGRVRDGVLYPFEINPRFSASTYLRALAGFNEIDIYLKYLVLGDIPNEHSIRTGWYLRTLSEKYIPEDQLK